MHGNQRNAFLMGVDLNASLTFQQLILFSIIEVRKKSEYLGARRDGGAQKG